MGMILRIASSRIVGQGDIVGRSGYFSLNLSANSVMRGRLDARRTLKSLVADLRLKASLPVNLPACQTKTDSGNQGNEKDDNTHHYHVNPRRPPDHRTHESETDNAYKLNQAESPWSVVSLLLEKKHITSYLLENLKYMQ